MREHRFVSKSSLRALGEVIGALMLALFVAWTIVGVGLLFLKSFEPNERTQLALSVLAMGCAFLAVSLFLGFRVGDRGILRVRKSRLSVVLFTIIGMVALSTTMSALINLLGLRDSGALAELRQDLIILDLYERVLMLLIAGLLSGTSEELFFRGYVLSKLEGTLGTAAAVLGSALLFGVVHFDPIHSTAATFMGIFLGFVVWRVDSITPALFAHVVNNAIGIWVPGLAQDWSPSVNLLVASAGALFVGASVWGVLRMPPTSDHPLDAPN